MSHESLIASFIFIGLMLGWHGTRIRKLEAEIEKHKQQKEENPLHNFDVRNPEGGKGL